MITACLAASALATWDGSTSYHLPQRHRLRDDLPFDTHVDGQDHQGHHRDRRGEGHQPACRYLIHR
jgi:hypothetical protein